MGVGGSKHVGRCEAWCVTSAGAASLGVRRGREGTAVGARDNWLHVLRSSAGKQGEMEPGARTFKSSISYQDSSPYSATTELGGLLPHGTLSGYALTDMYKSVAD